MGTMKEIIRLQEVIWVANTLREMIVECQTYWHIVTIQFVALAKPREWILT